MPGIAVFPAASTDPGALDKTVSGTVKLLDPFTLHQADGTDTIVYITGQTPVMSITAATSADVKPDVPVMLLLSRNSAGDFITNYIMIDASPILAFGM
jgi:hypothetical protein